MPLHRKLLTNLFTTGLIIILLITTRQDYAQITEPISRYRVGDLIGNKYFLLKGYPDTIRIGAFTIIVEEYDKGGQWDPASKTYQHLNGIGRIQFTCGPRIVFPWPGKIWKDAIMKPVSVNIVDTVREEINEISVRDAAQLGIKARAGSKVDLMVPYYGDKAVELSRYLGDLVPIKRPEGIRVRFTNLTVKVLQAGATQGLALAGIANYPSTPAIPPVPFTLNIYPGFQLEVNSLSISPNTNAIANARLILPSSLAKENDCGGADLNLGDISITPRCEFYKFLPDSTYGIFGIGATTLAIRGRGYVVDFSSTARYLPVAKPASWKGVVLLKGNSPGSPSDPVVSNIGYMQAAYSFSNALVESLGLTATFINARPYNYGTTQPLGYTIAFAHSSVNVSASHVTGGFLRDGDVTLPSTAVRQANDAPVVLSQLNLIIRPSMDLSGFAIIPPNMGIYWGDLIKAGGGDRKSFGIENVSREALLFFSARPRQLFLPISADGKSFVTPFTNLSPPVLDSFGMQGASFRYFSVLVVNTPDIPGIWKPNDPVMPWANSPVRFNLSGTQSRWLNVVTEGVHCNIPADIGESPNLRLGNPAKPLYVGVDPFQTQTNYFQNKGNVHSSILVQCVESAVIKCNFSSFIKEPAPTNSTLAFKEMVFTSTANNAGGKLAIGSNDSLSYWGLKLEQKPGFSSSGLVSVKTGQIILTAAGLSEKRHFAEPFWITWGEILANGSVGRLFFDFNSAGQQFDHLNFVHNAVELSPFNSAPKPFLRVGGMAHFPFFGGDYLHIQDEYDPGMAVAPNNSRNIILSDQTINNFLPTDSTIGGNWSDGLGIFNFNIRYSASTQDGFQGLGASNLRNLLGGDIGSTLDMNSRGTCIRIGTNLMDQRSIALGPVANISNITRLWGCACIKDDGIENLVVGGEVTDAANLSIVARTGSYLSAILQITPSMAKLTMDGEAYISLVASMDAVVNGHMQLILNSAQGFLEGELSGKMRVAEGHLSPPPFVLQGNSLQAEGQLNWHMGVDFQDLQGMVAVKIMGTGGGVGVGAGFYIGNNAPRERAWVLVGTEPRYSLNTSALPARLTGIYGSIHIEQGVNLYIISGGYDVYLGLGAFVLNLAEAGALGGVQPAVGLPYVVGNLGGRIHGEILGGFVSAAAYFNLQVIGPYPFSFQGTVGLEGCVLWVACKSVDITVGLNTTDGFYIR